MSGHPGKVGTRIAELLADEAAASLAAEDRRELEQLARQVPGAEREAFLRAASLVQVSCLRQDAGAVVRMPAHLRARLAEQGEALVGRQRPASVADLGAARERRKVADPVPAATVPAPPRAGGNRSATWSGWAVAAALALALAGVLGAGPQPAGTTALPDRAALLAAGDSLRADFAGSDARYAGVTGDVVWSDRHQAGYLRLANLPVNDRAVAQYQLWIIDPDRDQHPVDGGVFDVTAAGEVIIPVQARLGVDRPTTFAITLEKAGGVVVSAGPLLVVASTAG
jgi:anti-sigma-K factor RskA